MDRKKKAYMLIVPPPCHAIHPVTHATFIPIIQNVNLWTWMQCS